jgi:large subunit ribosomal protein L9
MAKMKIVLRQAVSKLGEVGDVVSVSGGYARNYLIPRGLAVPATKGNVRQSEDWKESKSTRVAKAKASAEELRERLQAAPVRVETQAGPDGRLFGSVTAANIAEAIAARDGVEIDRHAIELTEPIRHLGIHEVDVALGTEVSARVTVEVAAASE